MKNSTKLALLAGIASAFPLSARNISADYETISTINFKVIYEKKAEKTSEIKIFKEEKTSATEEIPIKAASEINIAAAGEVVRAAGDTLVKGGKIVGPIVGAGLLLLAKETAKIGWNGVKAIANAAFELLPSESDQKKVKSEVAEKVEPLEIKAEITEREEELALNTRDEEAKKIAQLKMEQKKDAEKKKKKEDAVSKALAEKKAAVAKDQAAKALAEKKAKELEEADKKKKLEAELKMGATKSTQDHIKEIIDAEKKYLTHKEVVEKLGQRGIYILNKDGSKAKDPAKVVSTLRTALGGKYAAAK